MHEMLKRTHTQQLLHHKIVSIYILTAEQWDTLIDKFKQ